MPRTKATSVAWAVRLVPALYQHEVDGVSEARLAFLSPMGGFQLREARQDDGSLRQVLLPLPPALTAEIIAAIAARENPPNGATVPQ